MAEWNPDLWREWLDGIIDSDDYFAACRRYRIEQARAATRGPLARWLAGGSFGTEEEA
jgi:hypothetical protein